MPHFILREKVKDKKQNPAFMELPFLWGQNEIYKYKIYEVVAA